MTNILGYGRRGLRVLGSGVLLLVLAAGATAEDNRRWKPLAADNVHDPASPAVTQLQAPGEALSKLPVGTGGNQVGWGAALRQGLIAPRASVDPDPKPGPKSATDTTVFEIDILLNKNGSQPPVRFPHKDHTLWLDCSNCHPQLFQMKTGTSRISKLRILEGEQCGVCHGAVAFPLTECKRCHNASWSSTPAQVPKPK